MMKFLTIPRTSLNISSICLGTGSFGSDIDRKISYDVLDVYFSQQGNFIDTAHIYGDWLPGERSASEKLIGTWMHERKNRGQVILATKGAHPFLHNYPTPRMTPRETLEDLEASLLNLQTDTIDLYWLHRDNPERPVEEILEFLESQVKSGKIRYYAASNWSAERLRSAQEYASGHGLYGFVADQMLWNAAVLDRTAINDATLVAMNTDLFGFHNHSGMAAIPYSSQANGLFSHMMNNTLEKMNPGILKQYPLIKNQIRFQHIQEIAQTNHLNLTQVVLAYLICQPFPTIPIIGPKNRQQVNDSLLAADTHLTTEQIAWIEND